MRDEGCGRGGGRARERRGARAPRVVFFVGCDEGDEEHATCARELTEACERELARGRAGVVENAEAAGTTATANDQDAATHDSDWGSWGDEDEDDGE